MLKCFQIILCISFFLCCQVSKQSKRDISSAIISDNNYFIEISRLDLESMNLENRIILWKNSSPDYDSVLYEKYLTMKECQRTLNFLIGIFRGKFIGDADSIDYSVGDTLRLELIRNPYDSTVINARMFQKPTKERPVNASTSLCNYIRDAESAMRKFSPHCFNDSEIVIVTTKDRYEPSKKMIVNWGEFTFRNKTVIASILILDNILLRSASAQNKCLGCFVEQNHIQ
ncbi:hypothetical protein BH09BAC5_BH09BAC5_25010 [soil metagenome]